MSQPVTGSAPSGKPLSVRRSGLYRYYVLFLLTVAYTLSFLDRQIIAIISPALKNDLQLSDSELGLLKGLAFALLYAVFAIPIAHYADRSSRKLIVGAAVAVWSLMTAASAFAGNFLQLLFLRIGVGIGEAGGTAPSTSIISDYFPRELRARALSFFSIGIPAGMMIAYMLGGWLTEEYSWRAALLAAGAPGLLVAALIIFTVQEPGRGALDAVGAPDDAAEDRPGVLAAARQLFSIPSYTLAAIALAAASFSANGVGAWLVDFFARSHPDYPLMNVYFFLAVTSGVAYLAGAIIGGIVVDLAARRSIGIYGYLPAAALALNIPIFLAALWVPDPLMSFLFWLPANLLSGIYVGPTLALAQSLSPARIRALSAAIFFFVVNVIALGLGPTFVGFFASALVNSWGEAVALQIALSSLAVPALLAICAYLKLARGLDKDWKRAS